MQLKDKVAVISGIGSGIGRTTATAFAEAGAKVIGFERDTKALATTEKEISESGGIIHTVQGDACIRSDMEKAVNTAMKHYGRLDVMVNMVGGGTADDFGVESVTEAALNEVVDKNFRTTLWGTQLAAPIMKDQGYGSIINVSSVSGFIGCGSPIYAAAKGGVIAFTRTVAVELAPFNIRCNVVVPGSIYTPGWDWLLEVEPDMQERVQPLIPMQRLGNPEEVAGFIVFLASDDSAFVTGGTHVIDGGFSAGSLPFSNIIDGVKRNMHERNVKKKQGL